MTDEYIVPKGEAPAFERLMEKLGGSAEEVSPATYTPFEESWENEWQQLPPIRVQLRVVRHKRAFWVFTCEDPEKLARFKALAGGDPDTSRKNHERIDWNKIEEEAKVVILSGVTSARIVPHWKAETILAMCKERRRLRALVEEAFREALAQAGTEYDGGMADAWWEGSDARKALKTGARKEKS